MTSFKDIQFKNLSLSVSEIEGIFHILSTHNKISSSELIGLTGIPKETLRSLKASISEFLTSTQEDSICLNSEGIAFCENIKPRPFKWSLLEYTSSSDLIVFAEQMREKVGTAPKRDLDQFFATTNASVSKAMIAKDKGMLFDGAKIALLGDDDLVSLLISKINSNVEITVFDVDAELLKGIENASSSLGFKNIKTVLYDVRNLISKSYIGAFDAVLTDPPYTKSGFSLFLQRSVELAGYNQQHGRGKSIFINYGASFKTPERFLKIQEIIERSGLLIEDVVSKFTRYQGAESIGNSSTIYILKTTPHTNTYSSVLSERLYTFENVGEEKFPYVDHYVFKLTKVPERIIDSKKQLQKLMGELCTIHKLNVVQTQVYKFKPYGYSLTYILSNSNLIAHTWPEYQALHLDLITCSPIFNKHLLPETLSRLFETRFVESIRRE